MRCRGRPTSSRISCTVPSSPSRPCSATNATSGLASVSRATRSGPTSIPITSWPSASSASRTRAPERSDTWRSSERPPSSTATRLIRRPGAAAGRSARRAPPPPPPRRAPGARVPAVAPVSVEYSWTCSRDDLADPPHALAQVVLGDPGEVEPHRGPAAAVEVRRAARHEGDVLAQRAGQQVGRVDVLRQRRPDEQPAARARPLGGSAGKCSASASSIVSRRRR